jgi:hypothetical protein
LSRHYGELYGDFRKFLPELIAFSGSKMIVAIEAQKTVESPELLIT